MTPRQDDGGESEAYENELLGVSLSMPAGWRALSGGQDYDIALVSPEALAGQPGALMTLVTLPTLGADVSFESALEPIAAQVESTVEPLTTGANEGMQVQFADEASGLTQRQVLFPYGEYGEVAYIQTLAPIDQDSVILAILESLEINPPQPDYAAANAAWRQASRERAHGLVGMSTPRSRWSNLQLHLPALRELQLLMNRPIALDVESGRGGSSWSRLRAIRGRYTPRPPSARQNRAGHSAYKALSPGRGPERVRLQREGVEEILGGWIASTSKRSTCIEEDRYAEAMNEARTRFTDTPDCTLTGCWHARRRRSASAASGWPRVERQHPGRRAARHLHDDHGRRHRG